MPERAIPEVIATLRHQNLQLETRHLVDQAEQLLDLGRHIEARALVEKAEAMAATARPTPAESLEQIGAQMAVELSDVFTRMLRHVQHYSGEQARDFLRTIEERTAGIEGELRRVADLHSRSEEAARHQAERIGNIDDRCNTLAQGVAALQQADEERGGKLAAVARTTEGLAENLTRRVDALAAEVSGHNDKLAVIERSTRELAERVGEVNERAERLNSLVRQLQERQAHRAAVLSEVLGNIARLKEQAAAEFETAAVQRSAAAPPNNS